MAKKVKSFIKLAIKGGEANPAPPVGPALGQHGLPIMDFVKAFNDKTSDQKGTLLPVVISVYEDRTFSFIVKKPPMSELVKMALKIKSGSQKPSRESAGKLTRVQVEEIAKQKMDDLNTKDVAAASKIVEGTARSMGIQVEG
ncbi:MAG TPA: 50S ribosomal protein L11 [Candidatus Levybacteria bacterium]|nr:50S ribosomal protein L11 [Candidatus Levybacteria bacterium]